MKKLFFGVEQVDKFFKEKPDNATLAKIDIFDKYFKIYFILINNANARYLNANSNIKYVDLFCGPGYFDYYEGSSDSTPINIIKYVMNNNYNVSFYFNDNNTKHVEILKKVIDKLQFDSGKKYDIKYSSMNAQNVDLSKVVGPNDIILSLIDSYSYLGLDCETINKLTTNKFSDVVCYFRVSNILEHIGNQNERTNHLNILGSDVNYRILNEMKKNQASQQKKIDFLVKSWIDNINKRKPNKYFLPFFIQYSKEKSKIESVVFVISKNKIGLNRVKSMAKNVAIQNGKFYSYIGSHIDNPRLIDFEIEFIKKCIGDKFITANDLIEKIDEYFINEYGYISAYSDHYIKEKLKILENEGKIEIKYLAKMQRKKGTFSDKTQFRLCEEYYERDN